MGKKEKAEARLKSYPTDFEWRELISLLQSYGCEWISSGGSHGRFKHIASGRILMYHRPHNPSVLKRYMIESAIEYIEKIKEPDSSA